MLIAGILPVNSWKGFTGTDAARPLHLTAQHPLPGQRPASDHLAAALHGGAELIRWKSGLVAGRRFLASAVRDRQPHPRRQPDRRIRAPKHARTWPSIKVTRAITTIRARHQRLRIRS